MVGGAEAYCRSDIILEDSFLVLWRESFQAELYHQGSSLGVSVGSVIADARSDGLAGFTFS